MKAHSFSESDDDDDDDDGGGGGGTSPSMLKVSNSSRG